MMMLKVGDVVRSQFGHDAGKIFLVIDLAAEYIVIANGRHRKLETAKRKKVKHVQKVGSIGDIIIGTLTNPSLWKSLEPFREKEACQKKM